MRGGSAQELSAASWMHFAGRVGRGEGEACLHVAADAGSRCLSVCFSLLVSIGPAAADFAAGDAVQTVAFQGLSDLHTALSSGCSQLLLAKATPDRPALLPQPDCWAICCQSWHFEYDQRTLILG